MNHGRLLALVFAFALPSFGASCLTIDSLEVHDPPTPTASIFIPGTITGDQFASAVKQVTTQQFLVTGHNNCKIEAPVPSKMPTPGATAIWSVEVGFYDKDGVRLGVGYFYVASLAAGEKFKHMYEVPSDAQVVGPVTAAKVRKITEMLQ